MFEALRVIHGRCEAGSGMIVPDDSYGDAAEAFLTCVRCGDRLDAREFFVFMREFDETTIAAHHASGWTTPEYGTYAAFFGPPNEDFWPSFPGWDRVLARDIDPKTNGKIATVLFRHESENEIKVFDDAATLALPEWPRKGYPSFRGIARYARDAWFADHWPVPFPTGDGVTTLKQFCRSVMNYNRKWQDLYDHGLVVYPVQTGYFPANVPMGAFLRMAYGREVFPKT